VKATEKEFNSGVGIFEVQDANTGKTVTIDCRTSAMYVLDGRQKGGVLTVTSTYDNNVQCVLNDFNTTDFVLSIGGVPDLSLRCSDALTRDHVVLSVRSFKGRFLQKKTNSQQGIQRINQMVKKAN